MIFTQKNSMYSIIVILLIFFCLIFEVSSSSSIGSRSLLRKIIDDELKTVDELHSNNNVVVELNDTNFKNVLRETPAPFSIVEFFAHWCPACRNYKPHYEKVARIFNGPDAAHPGILLMARVDCALKINAKLCDRFTVDRYPMLLWSKPGKFASVDSWDGSDGEIMSVKEWRTADRLLDWINKKMNSSYGFDDNKYEHEHLQSKSLVPEQIAQAVYDVEEATSSAFEIILRHKMIKPGTKTSLVRFLQLLVAHHPSRRCRKGSAEILVNFDELYPSEIGAENKENSLSENATTILESFNICGKDVPRGYWVENDVPATLFPFHVPLLSSAYEDPYEPYFPLPHPLFLGCFLFLSFGFEGMKFLCCTETGTVANIIIVNHHQMKAIKFKVPILPEKVTRGGDERIRPQLSPKFSQLSLVCERWPQNVSWAPSRPCCARIPEIGNAIQQSSLLYRMFCRGSRNDTRGFSCGLWVLLHSLSVRTGDGESHMAFRTICDFIHNFFICDECREHFFDMCSRVNTPLNSTRDFALWLWDAHNKVNERLSKDEDALGTGDPNYPKIIWPPKKLCPSCHLSSSEKSDSISPARWDKDEVFKFLASYYGKTLISLYKDKGLLRDDEAKHSHIDEPIPATNPVAVPIGAALAIAVASCAFGALACFWRSQQKSRKYRHLHSLKNI
ncbi:Sulfhydryl oxidase 2 [Bienertia sinuspersici]